jgi:hypothetical protein
VARSPLRNAERKILGMAVSDARLRAARGELSAGCACLLAGLRRMEEFVTGGEPWARSLLEAYRKELHQYKETYRAPAETAAAEAADVPPEAPEAGTAPRSR